MSQNYQIESVGKEIAIQYERLNGREYVPFNEREIHHGYDLRSFDSKANNYRYIELKTSRKDFMINRWLEEHEQTCLEKVSEYFIYYILGINIEQKVGRVIEFSAAEWQKYYKKTEKKYWYSFPKSTGLDRAIEIKV